MRGCRNLKLLPQQLGDMKGLQRLDVSSTAIEQLPDSIAHLKKLVHLDLSRCEKLRKLPEQFGNMEALETFHAYGSGLEQLPDSFSDLLNLVSLHLFNCSQLKRLPEQLGKMQCLEFLDASHTSIKELPDSIGSLPRIEMLDFDNCEKLACVPNSIGNLKSLTSLHLVREDIIKIELIEAVTDMKLEALHLSCNIRVCLAIILSFSSLIYLTLYDECGSPSPPKPFSFFQLFNLERLCLFNCTSHGSSFPELPLNLRMLEVDNHASLEQLPDLSYLKHLKIMIIMRCCSLQSLHKLPPHLQLLRVSACTSLQGFPDLSTLRDLETLNVYRNGSTLKVSLKDSHLQVGVGLSYMLQIRGHSWYTFGAILQNREIAEWFNYKNSGCTLSFDVPPNMGDNFVGLAFWVVYNYINTGRSYLQFDITNITEGVTNHYSRGTDLVNNFYNVGELLSVIECIRGDEISMRSGDKITVSFGAPYQQEVMMCGVHMILKTSSTNSVPF